MTPRGCRTLADRLLPYSGEAGREPPPPQDGGADMQAPRATSTAGRSVPAGSQDSPLRLRDHWSSLPGAPGVQARSSGLRGRAVPEALQLHIRSEAGAWMTQEPSQRVERRTVRLAASPNGLWTQAGCQHPSQQEARTEGLTEPGSTCGKLQIHRD